MHRYFQYLLADAPTARPRRRLSSRGVRAAIVLAAAAGVLASQAIAPLAASAQTLSRPHPARPVHVSATPKTRAEPWSAAAAAGKNEKTADYQVSPAVLAFLREGLGLRLEPSTTFTGVKSGKDLKVSLSAPEVGLGLPAGSRQPGFSRTAMIIDPVTGAVTLTSSASDGALRVAIANARAAVFGGPGRPSAAPSPWHQGSPARSPRRVRSRSTSRPAGASSPAAVLAHGLESGGDAAARRLPAAWRARVTSGAPKPIRRRQDVAMS